MNILMFTNVPYHTYNLTTWKLDDSLKCDHGSNLSNGLDEILNLP